MQNLWYNCISRNEREKYSGSHKIPKTINTIHLLRLIQCLFSINTTLQNVHMFVISVVDD